MPTDYTLLDATLEILLMLLTAFVLGWLFCWLMKKLFGRKQNNTIEAPDLNLQAGRPEQRTGLSASSRERLYDPEVGIPKHEVDADIPTIKEATVPPVDIETPEVHTPDVELKTPRPRIDIPDLKTPDISLPDLDIKGKVDAGLDLGKGAIGKGLGAAAAGIGAVTVGAGSLKDKAVDAIDDIDLNLKKPDVNLPDVSTELPEVDLPDLQASADLAPPEVNVEDINLSEVDLPDPNPDLELSDIELPDLSADLELPEIDLPDVSTQNLDTEIDLPNADLPSAELDVSDLETPEISGTLDAAIDGGKGLLNKGLGAATAGIGVVAAGATSLKDKAADKVDELGDSLTRPDLPTDRKSDSRKKATKSLSDNDLTRISGIDDSIAALLNSKGINTYTQLRDSDRSTLKAYLEEAGGDNLKKIEPASWPHQAKLCADKNWVKLSEYQAFLAGQTTDLTDSHSGNSFNDTIKDDLKKIEGIGPFFESLLNKAGINTFEQLKNSDRDTLKGIIDAAGPDYRMHEPETWPYQAGLADRGDWKKLQDYIQFMTGRN